MGFAWTLSTLLSHLPKSRQTLLFSVNQTQSVAQLARLSLKDPTSTGIVQEESKIDTPESLSQYYNTCDLDKKLDILWSFVKMHLQSKVLVFLSSGKQVRFVYESFRRMQPGITLLHLHGKQKQSARLTMYTRFTSSQQHFCLPLTSQLVVWIFPLLIGLCRSTCRRMLRHISTASAGRRGMTVLKRVSSSKRGKYVDCPPK